MKDKITSNDIVGLRNYIQKLENYIIENGSEFDLPNILEQHKVQDTITYLMWHGLPKVQTGVPAQASKWLIGIEKVFGEDMSTYTCEFCGRKVYESSAYCPSCGHLMANYKQIMEETVKFGEPLRGADDLIHADNSSDESTEGTEDEYTEFSDEDELGLDDYDCTEFDEEDDYVELDEEDENTDDTDDEYKYTEFSDENELGLDDYTDDEDYMDDFMGGAENGSNMVDSTQSSSIKLSNEQVDQLLGGDGKEDELSRVGIAYGLNLRKVGNGIYVNKQNSWDRVDLLTFAQELPKGYTIVGTEGTDSTNMGYVIGVYAQGINTFNTVIEEYVSEFLEEGYGVTTIESGKPENTADAFRKLVQSTAEQTTSKRTDNCSDDSVDKKNSNKDRKLIDELGEVLTEEDKRALLDGDLREDQLESILSGKYDLDVINKLCKLDGFMKAVKSYEALKQPKNPGVQFLCQFLDGFQANRVACQKKRAMDGLDFDEDAAEELSIIKNREG